MEKKSCAEGEMNLLYRHEMDKRQMQLKDINQNLLLITRCFVKLFDFKKLEKFKGRNWFSSDGLTVYENEVESIKQVRRLIDKKKYDHWWKSVRTSDDSNLQSPCIAYKNKIAPIHKCFVRVTDFKKLEKFKARKMLNPHGLTVYENEVMSIKKCKRLCGIKGKEHGIKGKEHGWKSAYPTQPEFQKSKLIKKRVIIKRKFPLLTVNIVRPCLSAYENKIAPSHKCFVRILDLKKLEECKARKLLNPYGLTVYENEVMSIKQCRRMCGFKGKEHGIKGKEHGWKSKLIKKHVIVKENLPHLAVNIVRPCISHNDKLFFW